jgi:O-antigen/teichoic acid export membrane protein
MNIIQRITKNIASLFSVQFIDTIFTLALSIFIARLLGDIDFGKYSFAIAFPTIFILFLDLGYETLIVRDVARDKSLAYEYLNKLLTFRILLTPLIIFLIIATITIAGYPESTKNVVYLFSIFLILEAISNVFIVTFRAFEKMEYEAIIRIGNSILRSSIALLVLFLGYGLIAIGIIYVVSGFIEVLSSLVVCRKKFVKIKWIIDFSFIKKSIKIALPIGMLSIFGYIYVRIDTVMLSLMKGDAVVGWYNAAYNLILGFRAIPQIVMFALLPLLSYSYLSSKESLQNSYEKSFKYLLILGLPISIGIFMLSKDFILLFYGEQYINSIDALRILTWDVVLKFLYICAGFILISSDKQNKMAIIVIFSAFLNIILNLFLIPSYSYIGSGIATLITEIFVLLSYLYLNARNSHHLHIKKFLFQPIIACGIMSFFLYEFPDLQILLKIILAIIIYFVILFLTKGFSREDILLFKRIIKKEKNKQDLKNDQSGHE